MTRHGPEELRREERAVRAHTRASLMSDTKWRKLLAALDRPGLELGQCVVKFVEAPEERVVAGSFGLHPPRPWVDTLAWGPIAFRSIEWLLFPRVALHDRGHRTFPQRRVEQDVDEAARVVAALGRYPVELSERGLLIVGHLPARTASAP
ncbi:MAG: hypothetical protein JF571_14960 [Asticcacaulis sp.]|nr:hypothetical protein [Asticcacaulis sp.]